MAREMLLATFLLKISGVTTTPSTGVRTAKRKKHLESGDLTERFPGAVVSIAPW